MSQRPDPATLASLLLMLAHDLRSPLSALHGNVGFLASAPESRSDEERAAISDALVSCDSLTSLVECVELVSRMLREGGTEPTEPVRMSALVAEVVARHRALAGSYGVQLEVDSSARGEQLQAMVHREMFARALANLVTNSIQHAPAGSAVRVLARVDGDTCEVLVADGGPQLSGKFVELAFMAEGQSLAKGDQGGRYSRGLGLYSARLAAEFAGAEVGITDPPAGATNAFALAAPLT